MSRRRFRGPNGAVVTTEVPGPGMDQRTFDNKVASGEFVVLPDEKPKRTRQSKPEEPKPDENEE